MSMTKTTKMGYILSAITVIGSILNSLQYKAGFVVWLVANVGWVVFNIKTKTYSQIPIWIALSISCIVGLIVWE